MFTYISDEKTPLQQWLSTCCRYCFNSRDCSIRHHSVAARHVAMRNALMQGMLGTTGKPRPEDIDRWAEDFYRQELETRIGKFITLPPTGLDTGEN